MPWVLASGGHSPGDGRMAREEPPVTEADELADLGHVELPDVEFNETAIEGHELEYVQSAIRGGQVERPDELGGDQVGDGGAEAFTVSGGIQRGFAAEILADRHIFHLGRDDSAARVMHLADIIARTRA